MKAEIINEALSSYLERLSRCEFLESEIKILREMLEKAEMEMVNDEVSLSQELTGMPHGTSIGDPTGKLGLRLACGFESWTVKQIKEELSKLQDEYNTLKYWVSFVQAWLKCLTDKERALIEMKYIQKLSWDEIINNYQKEHGQRYGRSGMKLQVQKAMEKVYKIAK